MTTTTNEMNLPVVSVAPMASPVPMPAMSYADIMTDYQVPADVDTSKFDHISVWAESITACGDSKSEMQCFDIVFCVSCTDAAGCCKTWKVVKRIAVNKCAIACQAETCAPVSVVEAVDPVKKARTEKITKRFAQLAGV